MVVVVQSVDDDSMPERVARFVKTIAVPKASTINRETAAITAEAVAFFGFNASEVVTVRTIYPLAWFLRGCPYRKSLSRTVLEFFSTVLCRQVGRAGRAIKPRESADSLIHSQPMAHTRRLGKEASSRSMGCQALGREVPRTRHISQVATECRESLS